MTEHIITWRLSQKDFLPARGKISAIAANQQYAALLTTNNGIPIPGHEVESLDSGFKLIALYENLFGKEGLVQTFPIKL
jgi:hypothetical protein